MDQQPLGHGMANYPISNELSDIIQASRLAVGQTATAQIGIREVISEVARWLMYSNNNKTIQAFYPSSGLAVYPTGIDFARTDNPFAEPVANVTFVVRKR